jgi:hypothetical protein
MRVAAATVRIRPSWYLADSLALDSLKKSGEAADITADSTGSYRVDSLVPGSYTLELTGAGNRGAVRWLFLDSSTVSLADTILPRKKLTGSFRFSSRSVSGALVRIPGLERKALTDSTGGFKTELPRGTYALHVHSPLAGAADTAVENIRVEGSADELSVQVKAIPYCSTGICDSLVIRAMLDESGLDSIPVDAVVAYQPTSRRITSFVPSIDQKPIGLSHLSPTVGALRELRHLNLKRNPVGNLPDEIGYLEKLGGINVEGCGISELPASIGNLEQLTLLDLTHNSAQALPTTLKNCIRLTTLKLRAMHLTRLPAVVPDMVWLRVLDLDDNDLTSLPETVTNLEYLSVLTLRNNSICSVSPALATWLDTHAADWRTAQRCSEGIVVE